MGSGGSGTAGRKRSSLPQRYSPFEISHSRKDGTCASGRTTAGSLAASKNIHVGASLIELFRASLRCFPTEAVGLHLILQRRAADAERLRRARNVAAGRGERVGDRLFLNRVGGRARDLF